MEQKNQDYRRLGLTIFLSLAATIVFFFLIFRLGQIGGMFSVVLSALEPVLIGMVLAYLLCPVATFLEKKFRKLGKFARAAAVFATLILAFAVLGLFCAIVLPQLAGSVSELVKVLPGQVQAQLGRISAYLESDSEAGAAVMPGDCMPAT